MGKSANIQPEFQTCANLDEQAKPQQHSDHGGAAIPKTGVTVGDPDSPGMRALA